MSKDQALWFVMSFYCLGAMAILAPIIIELGCRLIERRSPPKPPAHEFVPHVHPHMNICGQCGLLESAHQTKNEDARWCERAQREADDHCSDPECDCRRL